MKIPLKIQIIALTITYLDILCPSPHETLHDSQGPHDAQTQSSGQQAVEQESPC